MKAVKSLRYVVLAVLSAIWLAPVYLLIVNAIRPVEEYDGTENWTPPHGFGLFTNIAQAWERADLGPSIGSTVLYSVLGPLIAVVLGAMAGFAITVLRLRHGFAWFIVVFGGTVLPMQMLLVPLFLGYAGGGIYDSQVGLVLIYTTISVPLAALMMRNFFSGISYSLFEAAIMDGASIPRVFGQIYLPMARPALIAVFILQFTFTWNDLLLGLSLSRSDNVRPVMTSLSSLQSAYAGATVPVVLAGALIVSLPTVLVFLLTQRFFTRGLTLSQI
ncbi:carbohydrate ABC transporter permease [Sciscionella marina]|uniref:carbohydrate ABC transporter permease n=1 Tax=Sciscionella marina TaxID=508770 RepID=UPI00038026DE|nr:carbohydrate ABC transporter permease [Sciscionella marina]